MHINEIRMLAQGPKIGLQQILNIQDFYKIELPSDYIEFLLQFNGGKSERLLCQKPFTCIQFWCSVVEIEKMPIQSIVALNRNANPDPPPEGKYLIIAQDEGNKYIFMQVQGENKFGIGFWKYQDPTNNTILFKSFEELIAKCRHVTYEEYDNILTK